MNKIVQDSLGYALAQRYESRGHQNVTTILNSLRWHFPNSICEREGYKTHHFGACSVKPSIFIFVGSPLLLSRETRSRYRLLQLLSGCSGRYLKYGLSCCWKKGKEIRARSFLKEQQRISKVGGIFQVKLEK